MWVLQVVTCKIVTVTLFFSLCLLNFVVMISLCVRCNDIHPHLQSSYRIYFWKYLYKYKGKKINNFEFPIAETRSTVRTTFDWVSKATFWAYLIWGLESIIVIKGTKTIFTYLLYYKYNTLSWRRDQKYNSTRTSALPISS